MKVNEVLMLIELLYCLFISRKEYEAEGDNIFKNKWIICYLIGHNTLFCIDRMKKELWCSVKIEQLKFIKLEMFYLHFIITIH